MLAAICRVLLLVSLASLAEAQNEKCQQGQTSFVLRPYPAFRSSFYLTKTLAIGAGGAQDDVVRSCATECYNHPFCWSAAVNVTAGQHVTCELSYIKQTCTATEPSVAVAKAATGLLSCIKCGGAGGAPLAGGNQTGAQSIDEAARTKEAGGQAPQAVKAGELSPEALLVVRGMPSDTKPGTPVTAGNCTYTKWEGVEVRAIDSTNYDRSVPTTIGSVTGANVNEQYCAELCALHTQCSGVSMRTTGGSKSCFMRAYPLQFYKANATGESAQNYFLDNIKCSNTKVKEVCKYNVRQSQLSGPYIREFLGELSPQSTVVSKSIEVCSSSCFVATACDGFLFDMNNNLCYLLDTDWISLLNEAEKNDTNFATQDEVSEQPTDLDDSNFYVVTNVDCSALTWIQKENIVKFDQITSCAMSTDSHTDATQIARVAGLNYTSAYSSVNSTIECGYACLVDGRCGSALFTMDPSQFSLMSDDFDDKFGGSVQPHCILLGYGADDFKHPPFPVNKTEQITSFDNQTEAAEITHIFNVTKCGNTLPRPGCESTRVHGSIDDDAALAKLGPLIEVRSSGPLNCERHCGTTPGCKMSRFAVSQGHKGWETVCKYYTAEQAASLKSNSDSPLVFSTNIKCKQNP